MPVEENQSIELIADALQRIAVAMEKAESRATKRDKQSDELIEMLKSVLESYLSRFDYDMETDHDIGN